VSALLWWLIPVAVVVLAVAVVAVVAYYRRPTEDHDLGQFASLQEAMSRTQSGVRRSAGQSRAARRDAQGRTTR